VLVAPAPLDRPRQLDPVQVGPQRLEHQADLAAREPRPEAVVEAVAEVAVRRGVPVGDLLPRADRPAAELDVARGRAPVVGRRARPAQDLFDRAVEEAGVAAQRLELVPVSRRARRPPGLGGDVDEEVALAALEGGLPGPVS
jgi:hypothetical protein